MDKTMELILVSLILMVTGVIIISMANEQIGGFGENIGEKNDEASEDLGDELDDVTYSPEEQNEIPYQHIEVRTQGFSQIKSSNMPDLV
jgi:hypothetical protein